MIQGRVFLLVALIAMSVAAGTIKGRVVDAKGPLAGVRVYPDRPLRVEAIVLPWALTDATGAFELQTLEDDRVVAVEKTGFQRDLVPVTELGEPIRMHLAPEHRVERALVVRLAFPDERGRLEDDELRSILFSRQPGVASAANFLYEVSKGSLELEEGALLHLEDPTHAAPRGDEQRDAMAEWALGQLKELDLAEFDRVDNRSGALKPDGKPDHLWILAPGLARNVTTDPSHLSASSFLLPLPWNTARRWGVVFFAEETPLGNIVHELFHAMGEHRVDDLYLDCDQPMTAGIWDLMDAGQYRGWDKVPTLDGPWQQLVGYSPSHPMGWVRSELWYRGRFRDTVKSLELAQRAWTGWIDPLARAPGAHPQRVVVRDPRGRGRFWELNVRRPLGFERGRVGQRWGLGFEGLIVSRVDPSLLSQDEPKGAVRVIDAHPGSPEPGAPRFPCGRWQLDDAAYAVGEKGQDGALTWEVLAEDEAGRMQVRIKVQHSGTARMPSRRKG